MSGVTLQPGRVSLDDWRAIRRGAGVRLDRACAPVIAAGAQAQVKESTTNRGGAATGVFNMGYYLSVDFYLDAADVRLSPNRTISSLTVGATNSARRW